MSTIGTPPYNNVPISALGCDTLGNLAQNLTGKIAIVYRGNCAFDIKAYNAQIRGAIGVIIINHTGGPIPMSVGFLGGAVTIPVVMIGREQGDSLISCMSAGGATTGFIGVGEIITGVNKAITFNTVNAYPNPTTGLLTLNGMEFENIKMFDISGRMVLQQTYNNTNQVVLNIQHLNKGLYQVVVNNNTPIKIVKE
jgi:hypothetical protein